MGSSSSIEYQDRRSQCHVLIVGGGFGGIHCARELQKHGIAFTLVDPKDFFHNNMGALRSVVVPEFTTQTGIDYATTFGDNFVQGKVSRVDLESKKGYIDLEDGDKKEVLFTHVVLATGSSGPYPGRARATTKESFLQEYKNTFFEIDKSKSIVVIGGGATGVELAGEIRDRFPKSEKSVTLVHSGSAVLQYDFGEKIQNGAKKQMEDKGIDLVLGSRVKNLSELETNVHKQQIVVTESGASIECDLVFSCMGLRPDTSLLRSILPSDDAYNKQGRLRVSETLAVLKAPVNSFSHPYVYAIGDICDYDQPKMAAHAQDHGTLVADNIQRQLNSQPYKNYKPSFNGMVITIGKNGGVGSISGHSVGARIVPMLKGKHLFMSKYWGVMGQKMPKK